MAIYLLVLSLPLIHGSIEAESWTKAVIPQDYWQPLNSIDEQAYGNKMACEVGCQLVGQACKAVVFDKARSNCTLGDIVPTWADNNYIPEYIRDGKEIFVRKSILKRNALVGVGHLGYITPKGDTAVNGYAPEKPELMPVYFPEIPVNPPYFGINVHENTIVLCGGMLSNNKGDKHCR